MFCSGPATKVASNRESLDTYLSRTMSNTASSMLIDDDSSSVRSNSSLSRNLYRHAFESTLFASRPYIRGRRFDDAQSAPSIATSQRPRGWWSLYTANSNDSVFSLPASVTTISGTSLADIPSISNLSLTVPPDALSNSRLYDPHNTNPLQPKDNSSSGPSGFADDRFTPRNDTYHLVSFRPLLLTAAIKGLDSVVTCLLDQAANMSIERTQKHLDDALVEAVSGGHAQVILILLERGARWSWRAIDPLTRSSLLSTVKDGQNEIAEFLLERGASPAIEARDSTRSRALDMAIKHRRNDIIAFLLNRVRRRLRCYWNEVWTRMQRRREGIQLCIWLCRTGAEGLSRYC